MSDQVSKKKLGRPSKFTQEVRNKVIELAGKGLTDEQIGQIIGVSRQCIVKWRQDNWDFNVTVREAKLFADMQVEAALYKRATGFKEKIKRQKLDKFGNVHTIEEEVTYAPDTVAASFWLRNRQPEIWREKTEVSHTAVAGPTVVINLPSNGRESLPAAEPKLIDAKTEHTAAEFMEENRGLMEDLAKQEQDSPVSHNDLVEQESGKGESAQVQTEKNRESKDE